MKNKTIAQILLALFISLVLCGMYTGATLKTSWLQFPLSLGSCVFQIWAIRRLWISKEQ